MSDLSTDRKRRVTRDDILPLSDYGKIRRERRTRITELKKQRRVEVGPIATFYFENFDTMWQQIQEMLYIEKGGEPQIQEELDAYNPLIPQGRELVATVMFEIPDAGRRHSLLQSLGGVENHAIIDVGGQRIRGEADPTRENTSAEGKASSVQFLRFTFTPEQIALFRERQATVLLGFDHPHYGHLASLPAPVRESLAADFD